MEYLAICEQRRMRCQLEWRPRETNTEADDLTNQVFDKFDLEKRIDISWKQLKFPMINLLMGFTESFSKRKIEPVPNQASGSSQKFAKSKWGWRSASVSVGLGAPAVPDLYPLDSYIHSFDNAIQFTFWTFTFKLAWHSSISAAKRIAILGISACWQYFLSNLPNRTCSPVCKISL